MSYLDSFDADTRRPRKKATVKRNLDLTKPVRRQRHANRKRPETLDMSLGKKQRHSMVNIDSVLVLGAAASPSTRDAELLTRIEQLESQVTQMKATLTKLRRQQVVARKKASELNENVQVSFHGYRPTLFVALGIDHGWRRCVYSRSLGTRTNPSESSHKSVRHDESRSTLHRRNSTSIRASWSRRRIARPCWYVSYSEWVATLTSGNQCWSPTRLC